MFLVLCYCFWCFRCFLFFFECSGAHRDLHVLTHSFPTRRSSDLQAGRARVGDRRGERRLVRAHLVGAVEPRAGKTGRQNHQAVTSLKKVSPNLLWNATASGGMRSEEHTSELQSLMRTSYAVFCLKKTTNHRQVTKQQYHNEQDRD